MPYEDTEFFNGDCYGVCGEIDSPETIRVSMNIIFVVSFLYISFVVWVSDVVNMSCEDNALKGIFTAFAERSTLWRYEGLTNINYICVFLMLKVHSLGKRRREHAL